jgi:hypothetical protein
LLAALCKQTGWLAIDAATRQPVDLAGESALEWEAFRQYRDRAIRDI